MVTEQSPSFSVAISDDGEYVTIRASGEIDVATAPELEEQIVGHIERGSAVVLDLGGVTFIDSSGLRTLVNGRQRAEDHSTRFTLAGRSAAVDRLLHVTGLDTVLNAG